MKKDKFSHYHPIINSSMLLNLRIQLYLSIKSLDCIKYIGLNNMISKEKNDNL